MTVLRSKNENPLSDLIDDDTFELLSSLGFLTKRSMRDYLIRKQFKQLKSAGMSSTRAIEIIYKDYEYLQKDTIRKIVYQPDTNSSQSPDPSEDKIT